MKTGPVNRTGLLFRPWKPDGKKSGRGVLNGSDCGIDEQNIEIFTPIPSNEGDFISHRCATILAACSAARAATSVFAGWTTCRAFPQRNRKNLRARFDSV